MIRTIKMSMILGLGLLFSNSLVAMDQPPLIVALDNLIDVATRTDAAFIEASAQKASEFDASCVGRSEVRAVFDAAHKVAHQFMVEYKGALEQLPSSLKDHISKNLSQIRLTLLGDISGYLTLGQMLDAFKEMGKQRSNFLQKIRSEIAPLKRTPSQHELDLDEELNHQT